MMCVFKFMIMLWLWLDCFPLGLNCQLKFNYDELEFLSCNDNSKYEIVYVRSKALFHVVYIKAVPKI